MRFQTFYYFRTNFQKMESKEIPLIDLDKIIQDKNPGLYKTMPGFLLRWVKRIMHQDILNEIITENYDGSPYDFAKNSLLHFGVKLSYKGIDNLPKDNKRMVFVANHPLGGLDGMAFVQAIYEIYGEMRFPVNDILLNVPALNNVFLPVNKHGKQSRDAILAIDDAFQSDLPVLYFPAGLCSRKVNKNIEDLEWKKTFLTQAIKHKRNVVPVHINGKNSNFFYNLSNFRKRIGFKANIEMLYLVDEMVKQKNKELVISYGEPIGWKTFDKSKSINHWVEYIRKKTYELDK